MNPRVSLIKRQTVRWTTLEKVRCAIWRVPSWKLWCTKPCNLDRVMRQVLLWDSSLGLLCMSLLSSSVPTLAIKSFNNVQVISPFVAVSRYKEKKQPLWTTKCRLGRLTEISLRDAIMSVQSSVVLKPILNDSTSLGVWMCMRFSWWGFIAMWK